MFKFFTRKTTYQLKDALPVYRLGEGFVLSENGGLTVGFEVKLIPLNCAESGDFFIHNSDESGLQLNSVLQRAIQQLPTGAVFHQQDIIYYDRKTPLPNYDDFLNRSVLRMYNQRPAMKGKTFFFVSSTGIMDRSMNMDSRRVKEFIESMKLFQAAIDIFQPIRMENKDWLEYYESFFSCNFTEDGNKTIYDLSFEENAFGPYQVKGYSLIGDLAAPNIKTRRENRTRSGSDKYPRYNSWVYPITWKVPCYKVLNNIIVTEEAKVIRGKVRDFTSKIGIIKSLSKNIVEGAEEYAEWAEDDQFVPVYHHFSAFYMLPAPEAEGMTFEIEKAFNEMETRPQRLSIDLQENFLYTVGGCATLLAYPNQLAPSFLNEAVCFSNLEGEYTQFTEGMILADTKGCPVVVDVIDEPFRLNNISNLNWIVIGPTGSGKSVYTNKFISSTISRGFQFFIIDRGGSYKTLCTAYGDQAQYIELGEEKESISFNPFLIDMISSEHDPDDTFNEEMNTLVSILFIAWDPEKGLHLQNENSIACLRKYLVEFYDKRFREKKEYVNFNDIYLFLKEKHEKNELDTRYFDITSFLLVMQQFTITGSYGYLLNGKVSLNDYTEKSLIVYESEALADKAPLIYRLVSFMLILLGTRIINKGQKRSFLWLDEAWQLLEQDEFEQFIRFQFKTIRKKGGGIGIVAQEVSDIARSKYGENIINNTGSFAFLSHEGKEDQIEKHRTALSLSIENASKIMGMKIHNHEVTIIQGGQPGNTYKVQLSPEEYAVFTTTKKESLRREQLLRKHNGNVQLAIQEFVETSS